MAECIQNHSYMLGLTILIKPKKQKKFNETPSAFFVFLIIC